MKRQHSHLSDREIVMALDGELVPRAASRVEAHLAACWSCRSRKLELERAVGDFVHVYEGRMPEQPFAIDGPRALLKAHLQKLASASTVSPWRPDFQRLGWACGAAVCGLVIAWALSNHISGRDASARAVMVPNPDLTPGAAVMVNRSTICQEPEPNNKEVPGALKRQVFKAYGLAQAQARSYEVDYLITPALGGADDIHNLWPHSYGNTEWNARVKDALENQLRSMVCDGELDLATAQKELATNWIEAYKKYFHTDRPIGIPQ